MTILSPRAHWRAQSVRAALARAPLHRGRILRGVAALSCLPPKLLRREVEA